MPRHNRNRRDEPRGDISRAFSGGVRSESYAGGVWRVRDLRGNSEGRSYTCPGCQQQLASGLPHVVVWPADGLGDVADRRHWHTGCWSARDRRPPQGSWR